MCFQFAHKHRDWCWVSNVIWQCVPMCSSVFQCVPVCSSVFQCVPVCSSVFQCVHSVFQCVHSNDAINMGPFISCFSRLGSCINNFRDCKLVNILHFMLVNWCTLLILYFTLLYFTKFQNKFNSFEPSVKMNTLIPNKLWVIQYKSNNSWFHGNMTQLYDYIL